MMSTTTNEECTHNSHQIQRICMVVRNSVIRDARVMKEATSLARAGYDILIIGLQEKGATELCIDVEERLKVVRVPWRMLVARYEFLFTLILVLVIFFSLIISGYIVGEYISDIIGKKISVSALLCSLLPSFFFLLLAKNKLKNRYRQYRKLAINVTKSNNTTSTQSLWPHRFINAKRHIFFCKKTLTIFFTNKHIRHIIYDFSPDVLHCHDIGTLSLGISTKQKIGCRLIYDAHEIYEEAVGIDDFMKIIYNRIHSKAQRHLDGFITINESIINYYSKHYPQFPTATLVMNATRQIDNVTYDGRLHKQAGLPLDRHILLFQGGFTPMRGIPTLVEAAAYLPDNWSLVFMGWGKLEPDILHAAEKTNKEVAFPKLVVIPPAPQEELVYWTAGATIGIIPYEDHGLNHKYCTPNKLWEYPNAGVPILVTPRVEMKKIVEQYKYGWILNEPVTPEYVAEFINSLSRQDIEQARSYCKFFIQSCHWGIFERNLLNLYKKLEDKRGN